jgi:hypothetical protein
MQAQNANSVSILLTSEAAMESFFSFEAAEPSHLPECSSRLDGLGNVSQNAKDRPQVVAGGSGLRALVGNPNGVLI